MLRMLRTMYHRMVAAWFELMIRALIRSQYPHTTRHERREIRKWFDDYVDIRNNWNDYISGKNAGEGEK